MRIIAGQRRGHQFDGPKGGGTRPTTDLVRESVFNILGESVVGRVVVDLFAGTGALGMEALSRGASRAIFVEQNRENVALIYRNLATLRFEDRARVLATDAHRWVRGFVAIDDEPMIVFLDPPYRESDVRAAKVNQSLRHLVEKLPPDSMVVVESRATLDAQMLPDVASWDIRRYGKTQVAIRDLARVDGPPSSPL